MIAKLIGGILLIVGTAIGGGILALPIATAEYGFINATILLFIGWAIMTASAFLILEVTLWLPRNTNIISMAKATLGRTGQAVAWFTYLLLLYSLLAAYIAGGSDFFKNLLSSISTLQLPDSSVPLFYVLVLGFIVFLGIHAVDLVNRLLMLVKFFAFVILVGLISPHVSLPHLSGGEVKWLSSGLTVTISSFGYATIIPSIRNYFHDDIKKLRLAIFIGSTIPLICYIVWDFTIMGLIPRTGENGLISIMHSGRSTSEFVNQISELLHTQTVTSFAHIFTSICLLTSFLGVALCLSDFLADGLQLKKTRKNNFIAVALALLPPLLIVALKPGIFIMALAYAGIYSLVLLVVLPVMMAWFGRYKKNIAKGYQVFGGKLLLIVLFVASMLIILQSILSMVTST